MISTPKTVTARQDSTGISAICHSNRFPPSRLGAIGAAHVCGFFVCVVTREGRNQIARFTTVIHRLPASALVARTTVYIAWRLPIHLVHTLHRPVSDCLGALEIDVGSSAVRPGSHRKAGGDLLPFRQSDSASHQALSGFFNKAVSTAPTSALYFRSRSARLVATHGPPQS